MGDDPVRLARGQCPFGGKEDGEKAGAQGWEAAQVQQGCRQEWRGQVGEDPERDGQRDRVGDAGIGEVGVLDQVIFGQAGGVGEFVKPPVPHQGQRGVSAPVMARLQERHRHVAQPQRPAADIKKVVVGGHPLGLKGGHLDAGGFPPAATDDVAVAALGDGLVIEAGGEVGGGEPQLCGAFLAAAAAFIRARSCSFVSRGGVTDFGAPFWAWSRPRGLWWAPLGLPDFE